jgi:citrate synthase
LPAWKNGQPISEIVREEIDNTETLLGGYGRPLVNVDERIPPFMKFLQKEEMAKGPHLELAHAIEELLKPKGVGMNMGAVTAAVCADLGFATREFHSFISLLTVAGMPPVYLEAEQNAVGSFLPMRCTSLSYEGPERRKWGA